MATDYLTLEDMQPTEAERKENEYMHHARLELARLDRVRMEAARRQRARRITLLLLLIVDIALIVYDVHLLP